LLKESTVYGFHACKAVFKKRPDDVVRCILSRDISSHFSQELRFLASQKRAYRVAENEEIERITKTIHHEGIALLCKSRVILSLEEVFEKRNREKDPTQRKTDIVLLLDEVGNPHNVGGIIRSAVHFGASTVVADRGSTLLSPAVAWTSRGAIESITLSSVSSPSEAIYLAKQHGYSLVISDVHEGKELSSLTSVPQKIILALGSEGKGVGSILQQAAHFRIRSSGTGSVESLNVSVAAGVILSKFWELNL
jgi:RNA methyltransferase, TrmH family